MLAIHLQTKRWERQQEADRLSAEAYRTTLDAVLAGEQPEHARRRAAGLEQLADRLRRPEEEPVTVSTRPLSDADRHWLRPRGTG